jgi:hypothetical protein
MARAVAEGNRFKSLQRLQVGFGIQKQPECFMAEKKV